MTTATRMVFVSRAFPADFDRSTYGMFIRLRLLLDALRPLVDVMDILFFVDNEVPVSDELRRSTAAEIETRWGIAANIHVFHERPSPPATSRWRHYVAPALDFTRDPDYAGMAGPAELAAVQSFMGPDVAFVFAHRLGAMCPFLQMPAGSVPPIIFDLDDIEHRKAYRQLVDGTFYPGKLAAFLRLPALLLGEIRAIRRAQTTLVCSPGDRRYLSRFVGRDKVAVVPNVAVFPAHVPSTEPGESLMFIGSFTYAPNVDAAEHLVRVLWPRIHAQRPDATLIIAGQRPERIPSFGGNAAGVIFTGFVNDLAELYAQVRVACCPIQSAGGTRIKIIEAAGYGRPVVSTRIGAEGLVFADPSEILLAHSDAQFVEQCVRLLGSPGEAHAIGMAARQRALAAYDRAAVIDCLRAIVGVAR